MARIVSLAKTVAKRILLRGQVLRERSRWPGRSWPSKRVWTVNRKPWLWSAVASKAARSPAP